MSDCFYKEGTIFSRGEEYIASVVIEHYQSPNTDLVGGGVRAGPPPDPQF